MSEDPEMSGKNIPPSADAPVRASEATIATAPVTAGALLRRARESAGLHVAALAVSMKVPVKKLEALEADRLDLLPDAVFVRALAASVCRTLKIDAAPVLLLLPQNSAPQFDTDRRGINAPFHASGPLKSSSVSDFFKRPTVLIVAALLLGAVALVVIPEFQTPKVPALPNGPAAASDMPPDSSKDPKEQMPAMPAVTTSDVVEPDTKPGVKPGLVIASVAASAPAVPMAPAPVTMVASAPSIVPLGTTAPTVNSTANPANSIVVLKAKGETWVEVTDATGFVQLRKTLAAGEVVAASGKLPLSVVVGRVNMTQVEVRGQAFNMDAVAKDNVARFEVK
jgi:cytoskeleton protein RodZ